ncbi:MAG: hypothetical protein ABSH20_15000 [Tepidisphaeraceae bacterium]|jgi:hypothetical protein
MINRRMFSLTAVLAAVALFCFAGVFSAVAADATATGTWKWSTPGRNNGPARESVLKLKQDGEKLTGTINSGGQNATDVEIKEGSIKGADITFKVVRTRNNQDMTITYTGKLDGDTITGKIAFGTGDPRDWKATRAKE